MSSAFLTRQIERFEQRQAVKSALSHNSAATQPQKVVVKSDVAATGDEPSVEKRVGHHAIEASPEMLKLVKAAKRREHPEENVKLQLLKMKKEAMPDAYRTEMHAALHSLQQRRNTKRRSSRRSTTTKGPKNGKKPATQRERNVIAESKRRSLS